MENDTIRQRWLRPSKWSQITICLSTIYDWIWINTSPLCSFRITKCHLIIWYKELAFTYYLWAICSLHLYTCHFAPFFTSLSLCLALTYKTPYITFHLKTSKLLHLKLTFSPYFKRNVVNKDRNSSIFFSKKIDMFSWFSSKLQTHKTLSSSLK